MTTRVGQHLGQYRLVRLLGEGGFAEVYLGEHLHLGTQAAIKLLSARLHEEELERFRDEARTIAHLKHPSIVRVLDFGVESGLPYLVMHYAAQGTLRQRHPKGTRLPPAQLVPYVRQVGSALQYAHDHHLIHRDVKPENMLLGDQGEVLLSDFGIALVAQSSRYQRTQDSAGTLAYMAPEQIQGHPRPASDQYALGIVLYEWLVGERPFSGSLSEVLAQHLSVPPPPLRAQRPDMSPGLEQVVLTALEKDPRGRFASIETFARAFEQACQAEGLFFAPTQHNTPTPALPPGLSAQAAASLPSTLVVPPARAPGGWAALPPAPVAPTPAFSLGPTTPGWYLSQNVVPPGASPFPLDTGLSPEAIEPHGYWSTFASMFKAIFLLVGLLAGVPVAFLGTFGAGPGTGLVSGLLDGVIAWVGFGVVFGVLFSLPMALRMKGTKITLPVRDAQAFLSRVTLRLGRMKYRQRTQESSYQMYVPGGMQLPLAYTKVFIHLQHHSATIVGPEPIVQKLLKALPPEV